MASIDEERTAFDQVAEQLRGAAAAAARGLAANRARPATPWTASSSTRWTGWPRCTATALSKT